MLVSANPVDVANLKTRLTELGAEKVRENLAAGVYGDGWQKGVVGHFLDEGERREDAERHGELVGVSQRANVLTDEQTQTLSHANRLAADANRKANVSNVIAVVALVIALVALVTAIIGGI